MLNTSLSNPRKRAARTAFFLAAIAVAGGASYGADVIESRISPNDGLTYSLIGIANMYGGYDGLTWQQAETAAEGMGGHLATVNSANANAFLWNNFAAFRENLWIGLNDAATPNTFVWSGGGGVGTGPNWTAYTNWDTYVGFPNTSTNHYTVIDGGQGANNALIYGGGWSLVDINNNYQYGIVQGPAAVSSFVDWAATTTTANYASSSSWNPASVPGTGAEIRFFNTSSANNAPGTAVVNFTQSQVTVVGLVGNGNVTFALTGGANTYSYQATEFYIGNTAGQTGTFTATGGTLTTSVLTLGQSAGSSGTFNVGPTLNWVLTSDVYVGNGGNGVLNLASGQTLNTPVPNNIYVGYAGGGTGVINLTTPGTVWNGGILTVGDVGNGTVNVNAQTTMNIDKLYVGQQFTGHGTLNISGSQASVSVVTDYGIGVNDSAVGSVVISNGGSFSTQAYGRLGESQGSSGTLTVTGAGSSAYATNGLEVGSNGAGTLNVTNGGSVFFGNYNIATSSSAHGSVIVDGAGSTLNDNWDLDIGIYGNGAFVVKNGGAANVNYGTTNIAQNSGANGQLTVTDPGSSFRASNTVNVGLAASGSLVVENGGSVQLGDMNVGAVVMVAAGVLPGSMQVQGYGQVTITGSGSQLLAGSIGGGGGVTVNYGSTLSVQSGGSLAANTFTNGGSVTVTGALLQVPAFTNNASGKVTVGAGAVLSADTFSNAGTVTLGDASARIQGATSFTNDGLITGTGEVATAFTNDVTGEIRATLGNALLFSGSQSPNAGIITLSGGSVTFYDSPTNSSTGLIRGYGNLATGGLTNQGNIQFSAGTSSVYGTVTAATGSTISIGAGGNVTFFNNAILNGTSFQVATGATAVFYGTVTGDGNITGGGTVDFQAGHSPLANMLVNTGSTIVESGATLSSPAIRVASLDILGTATTPHSNTGPAASVLGSLSITGGTFDLADNDLILHATDVATMTALLKAGYNGGLWNGSGIISSEALLAGHSGQGLGILSGANYLALHAGSPLLDGQTVLPTDVVVKYTYLGDLNLDGAITASDYAQIDAAYLLHPNSGNTWINGDLNFDGKITAADYALMDNAYAHRNAALAATMIALHTQEFGAPYTSALAAAAAPEPASLSLLALGAAALLVRRRKSA
jgi:T5SS/PEP-CTERM-associated repeat protein